MVGDRLSDESSVDALFPKIFFLKRKNNGHAIGVVSDPDARGRMGRSDRRHDPEPLAGLFDRQLEWREIRRGAGRDVDDREAGMGIVDALDPFEATIAVAATRRRDV